MFVIMLIRNWFLKLLPKCNENCLSGMGIRQKLFLGWDKNWHDFPLLCKTKYLLLYELDAEILGDLFGEQYQPA